MTRKLLHKHRNSANTISSWTLSTTHNQTKLTSKCSFGRVRTKSRKHTHIPNISFTKLVPIKRIACIACGSVNLYQTRKFLTVRQTNTTFTKIMTRLMNPIFFPLTSRQTHGVRINNQEITWSWDGKPSINCDTTTTWNRSSTIIIWSWYRNTNTSSSSTHNSSITSRGHACSHTSGSATITRSWTITTSIWHTPGQSYNRHCTSSTTLNTATRHYGTRKNQSQTTLVPTPHGTINGIILNPGSNRTTSCRN